MSFLFCISAVGAYTLNNLWKPLGFSLATWIRNWVIFIADNLVDLGVCPYRNCCYFFLHSLDVAGVILVLVLKESFQFCKQILLRLLQHVIHLVPSWFLLKWEYQPGLRGWELILYRTHEKTARCLSKGFWRFSLLRP